LEGCNADEKSRRVREREKGSGQRNIGSWAGVVPSIDD
jgi:hypothetical protein